MYQPLNEACYLTKPYEFTMLPEKAVTSQYVRVDFIRKDFIKGLALNSKKNNAFLNRF